MFSNRSNITDEAISANATNQLNAIRLVANSAILVGSIMLITNLLAIIILAKCKRMIFQIKIISINLAITDFGTGLHSVSDAIIAMHGIHVQTYWCVIRCHIDILLVIASIFFMTVFAMDRVFSLIFAMRYHERVTKQTMVLISIFTWIAAIVVVALTYMDGFKRPAPCICQDNEGYAIISLFFRFSCFLIITLAYIKIFWTVKEQNRKISSLSSRTAHNLKPAIKISIIVAAVFIMYIPKNLYILYIVATNRLAQSNLRLFTGLSYIEKLNSLVNPFLYVWRFSECRIRILKLFCRCSRRAVKVATVMEYELTGSFMASVNSTDSGKMVETGAKTISSALATVPVIALQKEATKQHQLTIASISSTQDEASSTENHTIKTINVEETRTTGSMEDVTEKNDVEQKQMIGYDYAAFMTSDKNAKQNLRSNLIKQNQDDTTEQKVTAKNKENSEVSKSVTFAKDRAKSTTGIDIQLPSSFTKNNDNGDKIRKEENGTPKSDTSSSPEMFF